MKRLALAGLSGFVIPLVYAVIVGPLTPYIKNPTIDRLAMYPVRWPILILFRLGFFPFENEIQILLYIIVSNVIVYSILSYFLLWLISGRRKKGVLQSPPRPPSFPEK